MPWFALDDGFDTHPKVRKAGNAAIGLFVRLGVHASKHLTEGHLDGVIVRDYGTPATVRKLIAVGMLHEHGHACPRCPQPAEGDYYIHDYLDCNKSRAQIEAAREAARKRQQRGRDSARRDRNERDSDANLDENSRENEADSASNSRENAPRFEGEIADQGDPSRRDTQEGATGVPSPPLPSQVLPSEVPPPPSPSIQQPGAEVVPLSGRGEVQPLIEAMAARGMNVSWSFAAAEWIDLRDAVRRVGVPALVEHAARAWQAAKSQPYSAKYFLRGWTGLQEPPAYTGPRPVAGPPSKTTEYLEDMAAIAEELRQQKMKGA